MSFFPLVDPRCHYARSRHRSHQNPRATGSRRAATRRLTALKAIVTPGMVQRVGSQAALDAAFPDTPEQFVRLRPEPPQIPIAVWINPPDTTGPTQA